jgi:hypothetical protein
MWKLAGYLLLQFTLDLQRDEEAVFFDLQSEFVRQQVMFDYDSTTSVHV